MTAQAQGGCYDEGITWPQVLTPHYATGLGFHWVTPSSLPIPWIQTGRTIQRKEDVWLRGAEAGRWSHMPPYLPHGWAGSV